MNLFTKTISAEQIHEEIDSAQDRLLAEANRIIKKEDHVSTLINVSERLKSLGFTSSAEVTKARPVQERLVKSKEEADLIMYYKTTYPFLKFLTVQELDRICDKYSLIYAPVGNYIGSVPEKNLMDIERAQKLNPVDRRLAELKIISCKDSTLRLLRLIGKNDQTFREDEYNRILRQYEVDTDRYPFSAATRSNTWLYLIWTKLTNENHDYSWTYSAAELNDFCGLFIAATKDHFNLKGLDEKGKGFFNVTKTVVKDPIVFRYVRGGVQVLTKWGEEANDELLALDIDN